MAHALRWWLIGRLISMAIIAVMTVGTLLGVVGVALATPLTAAVVVATRMLYVEDVLHDTGTGDARKR